ncbi:hypothetical protein EIP91_007771 [Steccherinum ochraceum]|uniref:Uncharacterized protein n=1 Tax=Steccherinum ochraceum TaxID=92696 RepID=A0A4R0S0N4_9APHY|nr:hypothetical protein EIP91_007771 [Steccherinum ochraceum]
MLGVISRSRYDTADDAIAQAAGGPAKRQLIQDSGGSVAPGGLATFHWGTTNFTVTLPATVPNDGSDPPPKIS